MTSNPLLDAALDYDKRGWRVIPLHRVGGTLNFCSCNRGGKCESKGKHPKNNKWQEQSRLSGPDIYATWDVAENQIPNLGLATGTNSGFWVLDIDPEHDGMATMEALVAEHGKLPDTFVIQTGSGGYHYYWNLPDFTVKNDQSGHAGQGLDVRGEGGQVVAAPSRSDKGPYVVVQDAPVADAPAWLLELVRKDEKTAGPIVTAEDLPKPEDLTEAEWDRLNTYAEKAVAANLDRLKAMSAAKTPGGVDYRGEPWNHTTFEVACSLIEIANSPWNRYNSAHADLLEHAPRDEQFDDDVVEKCWSSASSRVGDKARPVPEDRSAEPDPLLTGPHVRHPGGSAPTTPPSSGPRVIDPADFFTDKGKLKTSKVAREVVRLGPLGWGRDEMWWSYSDGVWRSTPKIVRKRVANLLDYAITMGAAPLVNEYLMFREGLPYLSGEPVPQYMNFKNTMLDWKADKLVEHDPKYLSTIQFPIAWNPDATCPTFDGFLAEVLHEDFIELCWEMIGYLMYSGNDFQRSFMFYGGGGNGKGALIRTIEALLGEDNISNEPLDRLNTDRFSTINLFGKIANIAGDLDGKYQTSTANFKRLTGDDLLAAEKKYGDRFNFKNWAVNLFSANKIPGSADTTEGYLRRWTVLHFHKKVTPNTKLEPKMQTELEGIAVKAVKALRNLMERGDFHIYGKALEASDEFAEAIDQVRKWRTSDAVQEAPEALVSVKDLYKGYTNWAHATNRQTLSQAEFEHRLETIGVESEPGSNGQTIKGIRPTNLTGQPQTTVQTMFD